MKDVVVIGAGIGGLTAAAMLAKQGLKVTVLEAHIYPGGCAGTFLHKGYFFDAGATLAAGFYPGGPFDLVAQATGIRSWPTKPAAFAMDVHMPDGERIRRWEDDRRWEVRRQRFGHKAEPFWRWQEKAADEIWALALRNPPWPPASLREIAHLLHHGVGWLLESPSDRLRASLVADSLRSVDAHLPPGNERLRQFIDAQLLISAQATSRNTYALYGAAALDLPRRGVVHVRGGMGAIAKTLEESIEAQGGEVLYRQEVVQIESKTHQCIIVRTKRGEQWKADIVIANLPPWNIAPLLARPRGRLAKLPTHPTNGWGAYMLYLGLPADLTIETDSNHHQILRQEPLGEGNSVFLSLRSARDEQRAANTGRAATLSTHTRLEPWWHLYHTDRSAYVARKAIYKQRLLDAAQVVLPGLDRSRTMILEGTPITFQRFTRRRWGWVGGFPQTHILRSLPARLGQNLWMVGDSIFPGQSIAAVALGGLRVARQILDSLSEED